VIATLAAALTIASSLAIDVPYVPQTDALCGGAAAAMVFRYWGEAHADAEAFAPLVDRRAGGIAGGVLVQAIAARGWRTERTDGSIEAIERRLAARQPVVVLLADRGDRYHYVVVTGIDEASVTVHDPSWGPSRAIPRPTFIRLWRAAREWSLVILPSSARASGLNASDTTHVAPTTKSVSDAPSDSSSDCDTQLSRAVDAIGRAGLDRADEILDPVRARCPNSSGPLRELAGVRFAQSRWREAATLARDAIGRDRQDDYAWDVLGSSLFMEDDAAGALRAWNEIGKPQLDTVRVGGLRRSRYQAIAEALDLRPNTLLTPDAVLRATHRLEELPDRSSARLSIRPNVDGYASIDVAIAERRLAPHGWAEWTAASIGTAIEREASVSLPGFTGQGELWTATWRWWAHRPRVGLSFAAPRIAGLPGIWRVDGFWEAETYASAGAVRPYTRETRTHGGLTVSDWMTGSVRYMFSAGLDAWSTGLRAASLGGSIERRWRADRLSAAADGTAWIPVMGGPGFQAIGARVTARSSASARRWTYTASAGVQRVGADAPMTLWPGAGEGRARTPLLRAHPLLADGVIDVGATAFGRSMQHATAEGQRWLDVPPFARVGLAGFVDVARASRLARPGRDVTNADVGVGLRLKMPGSDRMLRIDIARGLRDVARALTCGWTF